jgi:ATP-dependent protease HslVU (ClpYQ) peptidase subunit
MSVSIPWLLAGIVLAGLAGSTITALTLSSDCAETVFEAQNVRMSAIVESINDSADAAQAASDRLRSEEAVRNIQIVELIGRTQNVAPTSNECALSLDAMRLLNSAIR